MRVLMIPDQGMQVERIGQYLRQNRIRVDAVANEENAVHAAGEQSYSAILAVEDSPSSHFDPCNLARLLRLNGNESPLLVIAPQRADGHATACLDFGADDVIEPSTSLTELGARLRAMTRRCKAIQGSRRVIADLEIDVAGRSVRRGDQPVLLTAREFEILEYLSRYPKRAVSRDELVDHVWSAQSPPKSNVLDVLIARIRRKISETNKPDLLQTVKGIGFMLGALPSTD